MSVNMRESVPQEILTPSSLQNDVALHDSIFQCQALYGKGIRNHSKSAAWKLDSGQVAAVANVQTSKAENSL